MIDFPASPTTGQIFTAAGASWRYDGTKWVAYGAGSSNDVGRNYVMNSQFNIAQRGAGPFTATGTYTADRWVTAQAGGTISIAPVAISDTGRSQIGDEAATTALQNVFTGAGAVGSVNALIQYIENVRRLAGKTVTVSFWAMASAGAPKLGLSLDQVFGTGGSPSAGVFGTGQAVTLSTTWARYSMVFALPSVSGKTLGTDNNNSTQMLIWYSAEATTFGSRSGGIGVQSGTITIWGVQLEIGNVATPLEKLDPQQDLAKCQRFYQVGGAYFAGIGLAGNGCAQTIALPVQMRATPTCTSNFTTQTNCTSSNVAGLSAMSVYAALTVTASNTQTIANGSFTASADL